MADDRVVVTGAISLSRVAGKNTWELREFDRIGQGSFFTLTYPFDDLPGVGNTTNQQFRELPLPVLKGAFSSFTTYTYI